MFDLTMEVKYKTSDGTKGKLVVTEYANDASEDDLSDSVNPDKSAHASVEAVKEVKAAVIERMMAFPAAFETQFSKKE
jgi:hypothetical protein